MIAHIAIHTPNPESVDELIASMERFAAAGRSQPGLQEVHTMRDAESGTLLGLALWETREAFDRGVQAMRAAVEDDRFPEWEDSPPEVYVFEDVLIVPPSAFIADESDCPTESNVREKG